MNIQPVSSTIELYDKKKNPRQSCMTCRSYRDATKNCERLPSLTVNPNDWCGNWKRIVRK